MRIRPYVCVNGCIIYVSDLNGCVNVHEYAYVYVYGCECEYYPYRVSLRLKFNLIQVLL